MPLAELIHLSLFVPILVVQATTAALTVDVAFRMKMSP